MPEIGAVEKESKDSLAQEVPLDDKLAQVAQSNDFQSTTEKQAQASVSAGDAVEAKDKEAAAVVEQSRSIRDGDMIEKEAARFQMERTLTANKLFDQQPPANLSMSDDGTASSSDIHSFIQSSTFVPGKRMMRDLSDITLGRPRNLMTNRTSEMHVRELSGTVFTS